MRTRLDQLLVQKGLAKSRHQAQALIELGYVNLNNKPLLKPSALIDDQTKITLAGREHYVSRGGYKLAVAAPKLGVSFKDKVVVDVGSSTGGFTDYALRSGASKVYAVDVGTAQLDPSLRADPHVVAMEKTDIRDLPKLPQTPDLALVDVSFISVRLILPHLVGLIKPSGQILVLMKPQFETGGHQNLLNKGVVKNDRIRRRLLAEFENWTKSQKLKIIAKTDSTILGSKGNRERFYLLAAKPKR